MTTQVKHLRGLVTTDKDGNVTSFDDAITETWEDVDIAAKQSLSQGRPRYITGPGQYVTAADGALISMDASGAVYRDGLQMKGIAAAKLAVVGKSIYGLGKTIPSWWLWNGTNWGIAPVTAIDPNIFA